MAMQVAQSALSKKYGNRLDGLIKAHAHDETEYGFQRLPAGIKNGVAKLTKCYFEQYKTGDNKGEYYLRCEGDVVQPIMFRLPDGSEMRVAGLTTSIMKAMCETKYGDKITTQEENIAAAMNELRKLGAQTENVDTAEQLEVIVAGLQATNQTDNPVYFKFETTARVAQRDVPTKGISKGDILEGCFENWYGSKNLENFVPQNVAVTAVQDDTKSNRTESNVAASTGTVAVNGHPTQSQPTPAKVEYTDQGSTNAADIDALIEKINGGDADSSVELGNIAEKLGVKEQTDATASWEEAGEIIKTALSSPQSTTDDTTEQTQPATEEKKTDPTVGTMYKYKPVINAPGGKKMPSKKAVDVEIVKVYPKNRTVDLKDTVDGKKTYKAVSWDDLE